MYVDDWIAQCEIRSREADFKIKVRSNTMQAQGRHNDYVLVMVESLRTYSAPITEGWTNIEVLCPYQFEVWPLRMVSLRIFT